MISLNKIYHSPNCGICLDDYQTDRTNDCLALRCGHIFHEVCATPWLESHRSCPLCLTEARPFSELKLVDDEASDKAYEGAKFGLRPAAYCTVLMCVVGICLFTHKFFHPEDDSEETRNLSRLFSLKGILAFMLLDAIIIASFSMALSINVYNQNALVLTSAARKCAYTPPKEG